jgi:hypothetical protein
VFRIYLGWTSGWMILSGYGRCWHSACCPVRHF